MKIELTCPHCDSILRVDAEHAGKQLRCPRCQMLTPIPDEPAPFADSTPASQSTPFSNSNRPANASSTSPEYINPTSPSQVSSDETLSLILGFVGIVMNIGCGCLFPAWLILNLIGLFKAMGSNGPMRTACLVANGIGLLLGLGQLLLRIGFGILAFIF